MDLFKGEQQNAMGFDISIKWHANLAGDSQTEGH